MDETIAAEGRTLKEAVDQACATLNIESRELEYKLDPEHFRGGAETVRIIAWRRSVPVAKVSSDVEGFLVRLMDFLGIEGRVSAETSAGVLQLTLDSEDEALRDQKGERLIEALRHVVSRHVRTVAPGLRFRFEYEQAKERRESGMIDVAKKLCARVLERRRPITLRPMNSFDRRLVHLEVAEHPELGSCSLGEGAMKRVRIYLIEDESSRDGDVPAAGDRHVPPSAGDAHDLDATRSSAEDGDA